MAFAANYQKVQKNVFEKQCFQRGTISKITFVEADVLLKKSDQKKKDERVFSRTLLKKFWKVSKMWVLTLKFSASKKNYLQTPETHWLQLISNQFALNEVKMLLFKRAWFKLKWLPKMRYWTKCTLKGHKKYQKFCLS